MNCNASFHDVSPKVEGQGVKFWPFLFKVVMEGLKDRAIADVLSNPRWNSIQKIKIFESIFDSLSEIGIEIFGSSSNEQAASNIYEITNKQDDKEAEE